MLFTACYIHSRHNKSQRSWTGTLILWDAALSASVHQTPKVTLMETWELLPAAALQCSAADLSRVQQREEDLLFHHSPHSLENIAKVHVLKEPLTLYMQKQKSCTMWPFPYSAICVCIYIYLFLHIFFKYTTYFSCIPALIQYMWSYWYNISTNCLLTNCVI